MSACKFNRLLFGLGVQYRVSGVWVLYQDHEGQGYTKTETVYVKGMEVGMHTRWTQKGRRWLYGYLKEHGVLPISERERGVQIQLAIY